AVDPGPSAEDGLVDQLATSGATQLGPRTEPAGSRASDRQYLTDTDYGCSHAVQDDESAGAVGLRDFCLCGHRVLTLIAVTLIIVGSVFCYKPLTENDPGGRQPIVFGSQGGLYGPSKSPIQEADSDQEDSNIYGCPGLASTSGLEVSNPIFAGPDSDEE
uniref:APP_amyloid domain-containing protein n=1 Tax=Macrostomum lignano TaxID=282301 RepID=A0A1I8F825_9PLAT